jgi:hypothetical protein
LNINGKADILMLPEMAEGIDAKSAGAFSILS